MHWDGALARVHRAQPRRVPLGEHVVALARQRPQGVAQRRVGSRAGRGRRATSRTHSAWPPTPPPDARTIASTEFCKHAALAYKGRAMSVQPHPEFQSHDIEMLLELLVICTGNKRQTTK